MRHLKGDGGRTLPSDVNCERRTVGMLGEHEEYILIPMGMWGHTRDECILISILEWPLQSKHSDF